MVSTRVSLEPVRDAGVPGLALVIPIPRVWGAVESQSFNELLQGIQLQPLVNPAFPPFTGSSWIVPGMGSSLPVDRLTPEKAQHPI